MVERNVIPSTLWTMTEVLAAVLSRWILELRNLVAATSRVSKEKKKVEIRRPRDGLSSLESRRVR